MYISPFLRRVREFWRTEMFGHRWSANSKPLIWNFYPILIPIFYTHVNGGVAFLFCFGISMKQWISSLVLHDKSFIRKYKAVFKSRNVLMTLCIWREMCVCLYNNDCKVSYTLNLRSLPSILTCILAAF